ncbi:MAG: WD40/YVTN/BNR-like repeat-containing protein [Cyclobacteriaceae bacterium]
MKQGLLILSIGFLLFSCQHVPSSSGDFLIETTHPFNSSIRALEVVNEKTVWFAGSKGHYGYTEDGGNHWTIDSIKADTLVPHFRAIAVTKEAVFLLSIGSPTLLYRSTNKGEQWELVYQEDHPKAFYDAMAFWNAKEGIAMGDPTDGCLSVITTEDGGLTWQKVHCDQLPPSEEGEAAFAASNSNLALHGDHVWMVSGGKRARVFHSPDRGQTWKVHNTPITEGGEMTGIFTVDFWNEQQGIIFGGNWEDKDLTVANKARTTDGGSSWHLIADGQQPGYRSCVQYVPGGNGREVIAVGIPGISYSSDAGSHWRTLGKESYYTIRFASSKVAWIAGDKKIARMARR